MDSLTLKCHNSFQNKNIRKAKHGFAPIPLIFKLQQEVLKIQRYLRELELPKTDMITNFLSLENRSFENISFSPQ